MSLSIISNYNQIQHLSNVIQTLNETDTAIFDKYQLEKFTGSKDWHYRFDYYESETLTHINDKINENTLKYYDEKTPIYTEYIHAETISDDFNIDLKTLSNYRENENYIIKISTNISFKEKIDTIDFYSVTNYLSFPYIYYINNKKIDTNINYQTDASFKKTFLFDKGWNRLDFFIYHIDNTLPNYDNYTVKIYLNFLKNISSSVSTTVSSSFIKDNVEIFTGYFINSVKLIGNNLVNISNENTINDYVIEQSGISYNIINYEYISLKWESDYQIIKQIENEEGTQYILDRILIKNENGNLENVWLEYTINDMKYMCNTYQDISQEYLISDLNINLNGNDMISHTLSNIENNLIQNGYSIEFFISKQKDLQEETKNLKISNTNQSNSLYVMNDGSVGIGTNDTKSYSLYVANISNEKKGIFCEDDITILSDIRYKTDIEPIKDASSKILKLNGVSYKKNGIKELGLLAQEVKEILPELVNEDENMIGIKYLGLIGLLIEGFKELKQEISEMKTQPQ